MKKISIEIEDKQLIYPLVIFLISYMMLFVGAFVTPWFFLVMAIFIMISSLMAYNDYVQVIKEASAIPRWIIHFNTEDEDCDNEEDSIIEDLENETRNVYGIIGKPELLQVSQPELLAALSNSKLKDEMTKVMSKVDAYYSPKIEITDVKATVRDIKGTTTVKGRFIDMKEPHVNYFKYDLNYFLESKFESHLDKHQIAFLRLKVINETKFIGMADDELLELQEEMVKSMPKKVKMHDLFQVKLWMQMKFENYLSRKHLKFFNDRGVFNFGTLLTQDIDTLEEQFKKRIAWFESDKILSLKKLIEDLKDEILEKLSQFVMTMEENELMQFFMLQEVPLYMLYSNYYFYRITLSRKFEVPIRDEEHGDKVLKSSKLIVILPQLFEKSIRYKPRELMFQGFPVRVSTTERVELIFKTIYKKDTPIFYVNSCSYSRKYVKDNLKPEGDKILVGIVNALVKDINAVENEKTKVLWQYGHDQDKIESLNNLMKFKDAQELANEDAQKSFDKKKKEIELRLTPNKKEIKIFWFFTIISFLTGLAIGWAIFTIIQGYTVEDTSHALTSAIKIISTLAMASW